LLIAICQLPFASVLPIAICQLLSSRRSNQP
jgi:hypothetical protein